MKKYLILSPFAKNGTKNSGDDLIVKSLINLLQYHKKINYDIVSIAKSTINKEKTFNKTNIINYNALLVPGFRISIEGQEKLKIRLKYIEKAIMNDIPVFLIGSSWCIYPGKISQTKLKIDLKEKSLLKYIICSKKHYLSTRDILTQELLLNNNIKSNMTGDLALYDINQMKNEFKFNQLNKIAISLPHNINYYQDCTNIKDKIEKYYKCKVYICTHQYLKNNLNYIDLSGNYNNLNYYKGIDMHIGFRLHGHLWFLRNRKPSFLISEDGRGNGHIKTWNDLGLHIKYLKNIDIIDIINKQLETNFDQTKNVLLKINQTYDKEIKIMIKKILGVK